MRCHIFGRFGQSHFHIVADPDDIAHHVRVLSAPFLGDRIYANAAAAAACVHKGVMTVHTVHV